MAVSESTLYSTALLLGKSIYRAINAHKTF